MKKKYLIYVDILGFEKLPRKIAEKTEIEEDVIRETFLTIPLRKAIEEIEKQGIDVLRGDSQIEKGSDNYVFMVDTFETAFKIIGTLITIRIPQKGHEYIPLEVGLDVQRIDETIKVKAQNRKEIIHFLKNDIISPYKEYYKSTYGYSVEKTFILLTEEFFCDLEPLDKKYCTEVPEKTFFAVDKGKILQRCNMFDFLKKIGYQNSKIYGRIDDVYVPPVEYEDIKETLKKKNIVFITGTQEYGKTYTAVRLMWEYYKKGYEPRWIKGGEERERITVRQRLEEIRTELKPNCIVYFEDPFGKTTYEKRESLEKEIGTIIDCVRREDNVYVIITSREEVFKEFEKEKLTKRNIKEFEKSLNLRTPSYGIGRRKEILAKWAESEGCTWFGDERLRDPVLKSIENEKILSTPLRIRDFAIGTVNVDRKDELEEKIREKSEEVAMAFSREIKSMSDDKILFLSFLFISDYFDVYFIREIYEEMVRNLCIEGTWEFDIVLDWFKDDKVNVGKFVRFSHPAYSEALGNLLVEKGHITRINREIFSRLLVRLSEKVGTARHVVRIVAENFSNLPEDARNKVLLNLAEKDGAADYLAEIIAENFNELPENVRNILFNLAEKVETAWYVIQAVMGNFSNLPEDARNILFNLAEKDEAVGDVACALTSNFNELPEDARNKLLVTLAEKDEAARYVIWAVAKNFNELPEDVRNILSNLAEKDRTAGHVANAVAKNFNELPKDVRNILFNLAEKDRTAGDLTMFVMRNFNELPEDVRNILFNLAEKDRTAGYAAEIIAENFNELPEDVRNKLLITLAEKVWAADYAAEIIAENFNELPEDARNILFNLAEKDGAARYVAEAIAENYSNLPEDVRNILLLNLAEKDEAARYVAEIIAENYSNLPEDVRNKVLFKVAEKDEAADYLAEIIAENYSDLPEDVRNKVLLNLAEKDRTARYVAEIIAENFNELPEDVRNILFNLAEKVGTARHVAWAVTRNFNELPENVRDGLLITLAEKGIILW